MIKFNSIALESREIIESYLKNSNARFADQNFTNVYMWNHAFCATWAIVEGALVMRMDFKEGEPWFSMPIGDVPFEPVFRALEKIVEAEGVPLCIRTVMEEQLPLIEERFPGVFEVSLRESYNDYIYSAEKLATLAGKKLHGKRNHINRFLEAGPWHTELITPDKLQECRAFAESWFGRKIEETDLKYDGEMRAFYCMLDNFENFSAEGMMLYQNDRLVAFTFGEVLSKDSMLVHFEKADASVNGAYPMINREFARYMTEKYPQIEYINREEDMGVEGLRKAKQSYYPVMMGKKYNLTAMKKLE